MFKKLLSLSAAAAIVAFTATAAPAATSTNVMSVTATLNAAACTVTAPAALAFGSFTLQALQAPAGIPASANLTVNCTNLAPYTIALSGSAGGACPVAPGSRNLVSGVPPASSNIPYNIYMPTAPATVWCDGTAGSGLVNGTGTGALQTIAINAHTLLGPGLTVPAGSYTDSINITTTF